MNVAMVGKILPWLFLLSSFLPRSCAILKEKKASGIARIKGGVGYMGHHGLKKFTHKFGLD